ncbi:cache domain-containing protein [Bacillus sp. FJAT-45066]|uniref:cache domain-containing protein n=1 Tax=Bacillus sp. FJAT-45066 TaxID=2011010 RepID=UPI000BB8B6AF|nr:cache domain-containing protein [Bacillus sp. FJAT-45066]
MKKVLIGFMFIIALVFLFGCSMKNDLPYALSAEQFKVVYVVPGIVAEGEHKEQLKWLQDLQDEHKGVVLIAMDLELINKEFPSLNANQSPYFYVLNQDDIVFEGSNFEGAQKYLIENTD